MLEVILKITSANKSIAASGKIFQTSSVAILFTLVPA